MYEWIILFMKYKFEYKEIIKVYLFFISVFIIIYVIFKLNCYIKINLIINLICLG